MPDPKDLPESDQRELRLFKTYLEAMPASTVCRSWRERNDRESYRSKQGKRYR